MSDIVLFGGTSEGRLLAEFLETQNIPSLVCVATEYGQSLLHLKDTVKVMTGRLDEQAMIELLKKEKPLAVVDATHPYADIVTKNIQKACQSVGVTCLRLHRDSVEADKGHIFSTLEEAIAWINTQPGIVFSSLGAKTAKDLCAISDYQERVYLRVLPFPAGISSCAELGYPMAHIIGMQGPFSRRINEAMFLETKASILLTKEAGAGGGFPEKLEAARACGMQIAIVARPDDVAGLSMDEMKKAIMECARGARAVQEES